MLTNGEIKTTVPKAKELRPKLEKLITMARKGGLSNRRRVIAKLDDVAVGNSLVDVLAPQIKRGSGYLRIVKLDENRVGDNAPMAKVEFVDKLVFGDQESETTEADKTPVTEEKPVAKTETTAAAAKPKTAKTAQKETK
jgi:large subunit ribosomal protein L17